MRRSRRSRFERRARKGVHMPCLHIAAGGRARRPRKDVSHGFLRHRRRQKGAAGIAGRNGVEDVHGNNSNP